MARIVVDFNLWIISIACFILTLLPDAAQSLCPSSQWLQSGDSCYYLSHLSLNFEDARNNCQELGGYLMHVRNAEENLFLQNLCTSHHIVPCADDWEIWIGLYRDNPCEGCSLNERRMNWYWVDLHRPLVWANWLDRTIGKSEPTESELCSRVWTDGGKWGSKDCSSKLSFVCETKSFTTTTSTTTQSTTAQSTTTEIETTVIFHTTSEIEPITNDSIVASSTIQSYPQYGENIQSDSSAATAGFVIGSLTALFAIGGIIAFVVWKYRKTWYKVQLDQGVYFQPMVMERSGTPCVTMDTEEGATALQPHYEDEALNIYETIPLDEVKDNRTNAAKLKDRNPSSENLVADASQPSTSRRHSNNYVTPEDMYSSVV